MRGSSIKLRPGVEAVRESATLAINQTVARLRAEGQEVGHFGFGESPFPVPDALHEALQENAHRKSYLPTRGLAQLTQVIADFYQTQFGYSFSAEDVFVGPGSKELFFQLLFLLDGPLILPAPSWVSYAPQARLCGKTVELTPCRFDDRYQIDSRAFERLCERLGPGQKILIVNSPNNPTGRILPAALVTELTNICRKHTVIVISDEIYALTNFFERSPHSLATHYPEGTIVMGGLSKAFSAGGYRFGTALIPESMHELKTALATVISETFSAVSSPIQYAALAVYSDYERVRAHVEACTAIHALAGGYLHRRFQEMGLRCQKPEGGFYLFPDFSPFRQQLARAGIRSDRELAFALLEQRHIAVLPGSEFNVDPKKLAIRVAGVDYDGQAALDLHAEGVEDPKLLFPRMVAACSRMAAWLHSLD